jgi:hypothetical protein
MVIKNDIARVLLVASYDANARPTWTPVSCFGVPRLCQPKVRIQGVVNNSTACKRICDVAGVADVYNLVCGVVSEVVCGKLGR